METLIISLSLLTYSVQESSIFLSTSTKNSYTKRPYGLYYGILDHVKSAKCSPFDGNRLHLALSITGWSTRDGGHEVMTLSIRASQSSGWCCVAHGNVVHVYDWMME